MWTEIGVSVMALAVLVGLARFLRMGEGRIADEGLARHVAEQHLAGFVAGRALVSGDGNAALVAGNGAIAVLQRHGARIAARRLIAPLDVRAAAEGSVIETGERMFGAVTLFGVTKEEVHSLKVPLTLV
ncbi:hypothetical protein [uncultured Sphingomonas sp.]|uniref:hypothetical protein n=1 Tax=uncultured Sphingomonas sp. TaxID=158754 RepID=UPI0035CC4057